MLLGQSSIFEIWLIREMFYLQHFCFILRREQSLKASIFSECNSGAISTPTSPRKDSFSATRTSFSEPVSDDSG